MFNTNINGFVDDSNSFCFINRLRGSNHRQRETSLFDNIELAIRLFNRDGSNIQRSSYFVKNSTVGGFWFEWPLQSNIWKGTERNRDRKLPIQLDYWGYFKVNNKGG